MDDVEAEAVLRALAEQLQWVSLGRSAWAVFTLRDGRRGRYFVHVRQMMGAAGGTASLLYLYDAEVDIPTQIRKSSPRYKTQSDAKAACERHYATGSWE